MSGQQFYRERAEEDTRRYGFKPGELQWLWRGLDCLKRKYDSGEVTAAICDALTREGQTAWPGDGTSCVEQMIRLQWDRAVKAEAEVAALQSEIAKQREEYENRIVRAASTHLDQIASLSAELARQRETTLPPEEWALIGSVELEHDQFCGAWNNYPEDCDCTWRKHNEAVAKLNEKIRLWSASVVLAVDPSVAGQ